MTSSWKSSSKKRRQAKASSATANVEPPRYRDREGRIHLVLNTDSRGAKVATGLSGKLFEETWQETIALSAANTVIRHFGELPLVADAQQIAQEAMDALSKLSAGLSEQASPARVACAAGCAHCCYQSVGATGIEVVAIVEHLRASLNEDDFATLASKVRTTREKSHGLTYAQRYSPEFPCVFLGETGDCTVYPVRPLVCRAMNSLNAETCRAILHDEKQRAAFVSDGQGPDSLLGPFRASHALSAGLQLAGSQVYGLDMRPLDLVAALDVLMHAPSASKEWLAGQPTLASALGSDASSNSQLRSIAGVTSNEDPAT